MYIDRVLFKVVSKMHHPSTVVMVVIPSQGILMRYLTTPRPSLKKGGEQVPEKNARFIKKTRNGNTITSP
jgi:hypothetical protein